MIVCTISVGADNRGLEERKITEGKEELLWKLVRLI